MKLRSFPKMLFSCDVMHKHSWSHSQQLD